MTLRLIIKLCLWANLLRSLRWDYLKFEVSLGNLARTCPKTKIKKNVADHLPSMHKIRKAWDSGPGVSLILPSAPSVELYYFTENNLLVYFIRNRRVYFFLDWINLRMCAQGSNFYVPLSSYYFYTLFITYLQQIGLFSWTTSGPAKVQWYYFRII